MIAPSRQIRLVRRPPEWLEEAGLAGSASVGIGIAAHHCAGVFAVSCAPDEMQCFGVPDNIYDW